MNLESLQDAYIHLSDQERFVFAQFVLADYGKNESVFSPDDMAEIERRVAAVESGLVKTISGEEVESYIRQKYGF